ARGPPCRRRARTTARRSIQSASGKHLFDESAVSEDMPWIIWLSRAAALCYDAPAMPATVIRDTTLITCNPERAILRNASIAIEGDRIAAIGGSEIAGSYPDADVIEGRGKAVLPGLINSHTHVWYTVARGIQEDFGYPPIVPTAVHDTLSA